MDSEELENWIYSFCYHQPYGRRGSSDSSVGIPYQLAITSHLHIPLYTSGTASLFFQCFTSKSKKDSRIMTVCYSLQFSALDSWFFLALQKLAMWPTPDQCNRCIDLHGFTPHVFAPGQNNSCDCSK